MTEDVALALIEMRLASARERHDLARVREARRSARRAQRADADTTGVRVWRYIPWHALPGRVRRDRSRRRVRILSGRRIPTTSE